MDTPQLDICRAHPGTPFSMRTAHHLLYSLSFLHTGASKFWIVVPPHARQRLECYLERYQQACWGEEWAGLSRCDQFVYHLSVWVCPGALAKWGVPYRLVEQRPGYMMVLAPGAYHQGWSTGANVAESTVYADGDSAARYYSYRHCSVLCAPNHEAGVLDDRLWPVTESQEHEALATDVCEEPWSAVDIPGSSAGVLAYRDIFATPGSCTPSKASFS